MTAVRTHRYTLDPAVDLDGFLTRRTELVAAIRMDHPGLVEVRLTKLDDGSFSDVWRWDGTDTMRAALAALPSFPQARATMALTRDNVVVDGEIIDER
jgi:hypothetical protein